MSFPFSAVVGQDEAKLALLLNAVDPRIGGVLLRGQKGSAKTTLARGLAALLPPGAPFVELPIGATEDRLVGTLDVSRVLTTGERRFEPGLLAAANGGVLYVDEINLLPDHLVDVLLDVAVSGVNRVERDGMSHVHPSRFVLVGSMNPEEGELRPQLLDRFGLSAEIGTPAGGGHSAAVVVGRRSQWGTRPVGGIGGGARRSSRGGSTGRVGGGPGRRRCPPVCRHGCRRTAGRPHDLPCRRRPGWLGGPDNGPGVRHPNGGPAGPRPPGPQGPL